MHDGVVIVCYSYIPSIEDRWRANGNNPTATKTVSRTFNHAGRHRRVRRHGGNHFAARHERVRAKGLGQDVLEALQYANVGQGILAGIAILFVALILDRVVQGKKRV